MSTRTWILLLALFFTLPAQAQDVVVYGLLRDHTSKEPLSGGLVELKNGEGVLVDRWVTSDSGDYLFHLPLDDVYSLHYHAPAYFTKWLQMDLRNITASEEERAGGWGMNVDVTLFPKFEGVSDSLLAKPYGYAAWNAADTLFAWDLEHTQHMRDAWAPLVKHLTIADRPAVQEPQEPLPGWTAAVFLLMLVLLARYLLPRVVHKLADRPVLQRSIFFALLVTGLLCAVFVVMNWRNDAVQRAYVMVAAALAFMSFMGALVLSRTLLEQWLPNEVPLLPDERERDQRRYKRVLYIAAIPVFLCLFGLFGSIDHTLRPEVYFLRHAGWALTLFVLLRLLLSKAARSWFFTRAYRFRFWSLFVVVLLIVVPGTIHFVDQQMAEPGPVRVAEVTRLLEKTQRKKGTTYYVSVLVDGREKELKLDKAQWDELSTTDALELTISTGPFDIEHISAWKGILRSVDDGSTDEQAGEEADAS